MEEFRSDKAELEKAISELLGKFANKHKVRIDRVDTDSYPGDVMMLSGGKIEQEQSFNVAVRVVL